MAESTTGSCAARAGARPANRYACLGEVRGAGLFIGVDVINEQGPDGDAAARVVNELRLRGVLISSTGPHGHVLKIRPPLVFRSEHAEFFLEQLEATLRSL